MPQQATLYRMVTDEHICPFGLKSKDLLQRKGFSIADRHLTTRAETDAFKAKHGVETTPQTFIGTERIGGYDSLRRYFGLKVKHDDTLSYQPVIAVFATTLLLALAGSWLTLGTVASVRSLEWFISLSMCVLAILKLRDLDGFTNQFITYDLLARRIVRYGYVYPFAEALAGIAMFGRVLVPIAAVVALSIGAIGAVSVINAVYIEKRELRCACVGGNSNVPLGFISLTENLMMVFMAIWMLLR